MRPVIPLGTLLSRAGELATLDPETEYHEVTIKLWGKGVVSRGKVRGSEVGTVRRFVRANQLILSKIDARNGAIGIVPPELDGAIVSNDFPSFAVDTEQVDPGFLGWLVRSAQFVELCKASSEGTTNRVRIKEDRFLGHRITLPSVAEQQAIVAKLNSLAEKTRQVAAHLDAIDQTAEAMTLSLHHKLARGRVLRLSDVIELHEESVGVHPDGQYPQVGVRGFGGGLFAIVGTDTTYKAFNRFYPDAIVLSQVKGWEGALAVCPKSLSGMYVSPEYRTFRCRPNMAGPFYLGALMGTPWFWKLLQGATRGVGARRERTHPEQFLNIELPMPEYSDQLVAVENLSRQSELKRRHAAIRGANAALVPATLEWLFRLGRGIHG